VALQLARSLAESLEAAREQRSGRFSVEVSEQARAFMKENRTPK
jgi:hypothetical protein